MPTNYDKFIGQLPIHEQKTIETRYQELKQQAEDRKKNIASAGPEDQQFQEWIKASKTGNNWL